MLFRPSAKRVLGGLIGLSLGGGGKDLSISAAAIGIRSDSPSDTGTSAEIGFASVTVVTSVPFDVVSEALNQ